MGYFPCQGLDQFTGTDMADHSDHNLSRRAKLFALHQQMVSAGRVSVGAWFARNPTLDDATADAIRSTALASWRAAPVETEC